MFGVGLLSLILYSKEAAWSSLGRLFLRPMVQVLKSEVSMHAALTAVLTSYSLDPVFSPPFSPNLYHKKIKSRY